MSKVFQLTLFETPQGEGKRMVAALLLVRLVLASLAEDPMHIEHLGLAKEFQRQGAGKRPTAATCRGLAGLTLALGLGSAAMSCGSWGCAPWGPCFGVVPACLCFFLVCPVPGAMPPFFGVGGP